MSILRNHRYLKYAAIWGVGLIIIVSTSRMIGYLIAAFTGRGEAFSLTLPAMLIVFHGALLWSWFRRR